MYVSSSNPVTPDIFQLADQSKGLTEQARAEAPQPLNADITGVQPTVVAPLQCIYSTKNIIVTALF